MRAKTLRHNAREPKLFRGGEIFAPSPSMSSLNRRRDFGERGMRPPRYCAALLEKSSGASKDGKIGLLLAFWERASSGEHEGHR